MPDTLLFWLSPRGRLPRFPYIIANVILLCLNVALMFGTVGVLPEPGDTIPYVAVIGFVMAFQTLLIWMVFALSSRRLHDLGRPSTLAFFTFVPVVSLFVILWLCIAPGQPFNNPFGPRP